MPMRRAPRINGGFPGKKLSDIGANLAGVTYMHGKTGVHRAFFRTGRSGDGSPGQRNRTAAPAQPAAVNPTTAGGAPALALAGGRRRRRCQARQHALTSQLSTPAAAFLQGAGTHPAAGLSGHLYVRKSGRNRYGEPSRAHGTRNDRHHAARRISLPARQPCAKCVRKRSSRAILPSHRKPKRKCAPMTWPLPESETPLDAGRRANCARRQCVRTPRGRLSARRRPRAVRCHPARWPAVFPTFGSRASSISPSKRSATICISFSPWIEFGAALPRPVPPGPLDAVHRRRRRA